MNFGLIDIVRFSIIVEDCLFAKAVLVSNV